MTALSANYPRQYTNFHLSIVTEYEVEAGETLYEGGLVMLDTDGYALPAADTASQLCVGWADEKADNSAGADAAIEVRVRSNCAARMAATTITRGTIGDIMYVADDNTFNDEDPGNTVKAGVHVAPYISTSEGWLWIPAYGVHLYGL